MLFAVDLPCRFGAVVYRILLLQKSLWQTREVSSAQWNALPARTFDSPGLGQAYHLVCSRIECGLRDQDVHFVYELLQQLLPGKASLGIRDVGIEFCFVDCNRIS